MSTTLQTQDEIRVADYFRRTFPFWDEALVVVTTKEKLAALDGFWKGWNYAVTQYGLDWSRFIDRDIEVSKQDLDRVGLLKIAKITNPEIFGELT